MGIKKGADAPFFDFETSLENLSVLLEKSL